MYKFKNEYVMPVFFLLLMFVLINSLIPLLLNKFFPSEWGLRLFLAVSEILILGLNSANIYLFLKKIKVIKDEYSQTVYWFLLINALTPWVYMLLFSLIPLGINLSPLNTMSIILILGLNVANIYFFIQNMKWRYAYLTVIPLNIMMFFLVGAIAFIPSIPSLPIAIDSITRSIEEHSIEKNILKNNRRRHDTK